MIYDTDDTRISDIIAVATPAVLFDELPITEKASQTTFKSRRELHDVFKAKDDRLLVIAGPCSIHDPEAALEYAARLNKIKKRYRDDLLIIMRVYFEKPRTTVGWKGLINDPDLDNSFHINKGLRAARKLLLDLNEMGMPAGTEFLDVISPQYVADLISWGAIGARTTESQLHRELASGLSCPVGFKNGTDGNIKIAIDAIKSGAGVHHFLSHRKEGNIAIFATKGNKDCHVILRGGKEPNFDAEHVKAVASELRKAQLPQRIMIDFSHANSHKNHKNQLEVAKNVAGQISAGEKKVFGIMIESHLVEGKQKVTKGRKLVYGQSITDACLGWEDTEKAIGTLARAVKARRKL